MLNRRYKVFVGGQPTAVVDSVDEVLYIVKERAPVSLNEIYTEYLKKALLTKLYVYYSTDIQIEILEEGPKSYEQQELDSLGIGEDLIIRVQLSYNGKATKHLNITKEQFDAISKIIVDLL